MAYLCGSSAQIGRREDRPFTKAEILHTQNLTALSDQLIMPYGNILTIQLGYAP